MTPVTVHTLQEMKQKGEKFVCITAYDALFAKLFCEVGIEVILVGDSLGMVLQGHDSTIPVTMEDIIETLLGIEIVDEMDSAEDMRALARKNWELRAKKMGLLATDSSVKNRDIF